ncbi:phage shock protein C (PspC) family protein [Lutibacter sp. Hel_I_33_5]|uniref:PspC domain-containing protein n=1 Tax=Lutibacter sp. Hel_I_33_5 TaxID=1566289 RepID=UPI00119E0705|nr:PspC domain-containing protein [Lutibacter sp. Hel_I_33_5]TVZ55761.1 phage shock protein C (PspC) family protein [Lutibacter sp. Hel_I_33_5]
MNKTININLGGFFFHIDEVAYKKLRRYLDTISKSLSDDPQGKNEIIADIEARISELLSEKITDARQVVNEGDIEEIIKIMGQPEDYADVDESYSESSYSYQRNNANSKKLYRDSDDKFLGGVCSGIGHYFNVDVIWIRLAFIILLFSGFSPLIYIILWVLLPEARTTAEKLQMEGEDVNIDNIEKKIRKEFTNISENVKETANRASDMIKDGANEISEKVNSSFRGKKNNGFQDFLDALGKIILAFFKVIGKFIGVLLIIVAASVIISLIIGGFSVGSIEILNIDSDFIQYPPFFYDATLPRWLLTLSGVALVGIPFLILFILGLRILSSSVRKLNKATSLTLLGIWILALLAIVFTGIEFGSSYANSGKSNVKERINLSENDTLKIKMINDDNIYYTHNLRRSSRKHETEINDVKKVYSNYVFVDVEKSNSEEAYIVVSKESEGRNKFKAKGNAKDIEYKYTIDGNEISLDAYYLSSYKNLWRDEEVRVTIHLPKNTNIYFDNTTKNFLYRIKNTSDLYVNDMVKHNFLMTENGLDCTDCEEEKVIEEELKEEKKVSIESEF